MAIEFLYFDLGNVLLNFDHRLACEQMGKVAGIPADKVWEVVFDSDLEARYESGTLDDRGFYDEFCQATDSQPDFELLMQAGSEIFQQNLSILPIVSQLDSAGYRMGILSNTCSAHWAHCAGGRYAIIRQAFDVFALSYELGTCKPEEKIFRRAAELAGVAPDKIFYVDDLEGHVTAARKVGFDAVQYTSARNLARDLRQRGLRFNY